MCDEEAATVQEQAQVAPRRPWVALVRRWERVAKDGKGSASPSGRAVQDKKTRSEKVMDRQQSRG